MANKQAPDSKLVEAFKEVRPENPALSASDKTYLRGLRRRGFTQQEITEVAKKAGFQVPPDLFETKPKTKPKPGA